MALSTNSPIFKHQSNITWRRFSDFLGLHEKLLSKYSRFGYIIPPTPDKHAIISAKLRMGNLPNEEIQLNSEFLEGRRFALERFLNRISNHHFLRKDNDFISFLEENNELPKSSNTSSLSSAGMIRFFNKFGETVNKMTYKMDESDPWFSEKVSDIEKSEVVLQKLYSVAKLLNLNRKELSSISGIFSKSAIIISGCEEHSTLSKYFSQLATLYEKIELLKLGQSFTDGIHLSEQIKDYVAYVDAVKTVLNERAKSFQSWEYAKQQLNKKREVLCKLDLSQDESLIKEYDEVCILIA